MMAGSLSTSKERVTAYVDSVNSDSDMIQQITSDNFRR